MNTKATFIQYFQETKEDYLQHITGKGLIISMYN